jgi:hypothetical protein
LAKTCAKLGIAFWNYLGSRLAIPDQPVIRFYRTSSVAEANRPKAPNPLPEIMLL